MPTSKDLLIRQQLDSFPILPATVSRIMAVTANPDSSANDLMEAILADQSLSVTVLKLANSALFGRPQRVDSLLTAIMVLGFNEVQSIALIKAMINSFRELHRGKTATVEQFWEHAFLGAMAAQAIGSQVRLPGSTCFMAGLIHDIGKLVMLLTFADEYDPEQWLTGFSTAARLASEQERFVYHHAEVGGQLLRQWHFPGNLLAAVEYHHQPAQASPEPVLAQIVQLADLLAFLALEQDEEHSPSGERLQILLPDLVTRWRGMGLDWSDEQFERWQQWLCNSREHGQSLGDLFSG